MPNIDIAIFIECGRNDRTAVFPVKIGKIGAAADERHSKRGSRNYHLNLSVFKTMGQGIGHTAPAVA